MNVENINKVADAIEQHSIKTLGFNMSDYVSSTQVDHTGHECKTTACIAGWALAVRDGGVVKRYYQYNEFFDDASTYFGINEHDAYTLFLQNSHDQIQPAHAVAVLRHLAKAGEVDWSIGSPK